MLLLDSSTAVVLLENLAHDMAVALDALAE